MTWIHEREKDLAKSLIRWKLRRKGMSVPDDNLLEERADSLVEGVHQVMKERGQKVYQEFKEAARDLSKKAKD